MTPGVILLAIFLVPGLVVAAVLLWIGTNAILHGRGMRQEALMTVATVRGMLRSLYRDTVREALPDDFLVLLRKLARHREEARAAGLTSYSFRVTRRPARD